MPWRFFARLAALYALVTVLMVLTISPYFSNGWDPQIFAGVGRSVIDNRDVFDLYQVSRQAWGDWGFPYPPLYPHLLAPFVAVSLLAPALPDWLMVRALPVLCDVALAVLLYLLVKRRARDENLARLAAALWLFNPLTLYQTAIQAHQESSWLVCVVAAYALLDRGEMALGKTGQARQIAAHTTANASSYPDGSHQRILPTNKRMVHATHTESANALDGIRLGAARLCWAFVHQWLTAFRHRRAQERMPQQHPVPGVGHLAMTAGWAQWLAGNLALPSLLMALAVTLKQSAVMFYIPYVMFILLDDARRLPRLALAGGLFALLFGGLSLPYFLHSPDFFYLVYVDVSNMPVQTQSAVVWLLGLTQYLTEQTRSTFILLKQQTIITMALAALLSFLALRRQRDMARVGLLMALLFFLTSKKVMGYHYVLFVPFLLLYALPSRRFDLIAIGLLAASWIIVSPYYAPWASAARLSLYAAIGTPNTLLWLFLFVHVWRGDDTLRIGTLNITERLRDGGAAVVAVALVTLGMILSCWARPVVRLTALVAGDFGPAGNTVFAVLVAGILLGVVVTSLLAATPVAWRMWLWAPARPGVGHVALAALLIPVYFAAFALTQESTQIIETLLGGVVP